MIKTNQQTLEKSAHLPPVFNNSFGLFIVKPDAKPEDVLAAASEYLASASATAYETADNSTKEFKPLARAVVHQIDAARVLIEAVVLELSGKISARSSE